MPRSACRKRAAKGQADANTEFVAFFLEGMLATINRLRDRVNDLVRAALFESDLKHLHGTRVINDRQYAIASQLLQTGAPVSLVEFRRAPWYLALYTRLTDKTRQRDLRKLRELGLAGLDEQDRVWPGCIDRSSTAAQ